MQSSTSKSTLALQSIGVRFFFLIKTLNVLKEKRSFSITTALMSSVFATVAALTKWKAIILLFTALLFHPLRSNRLCVHTYPALSASSSSFRLLACHSLTPLCWPLIAKSCTRTPANDNLGFRRMCQPHLWPVTVMCLCVGTGRQTQSPRRRKQTTWDGYWCAVWQLRRKKRRGGVCVCYASR